MRQIFFFFLKELTAFRSQSRACKMYSCLPDSIAINHVLSDTLQVVGKLQLPVFVRDTLTDTRTLHTHGVTHTVSVSFMKVFDNIIKMMLIAQLDILQECIYVYYRHYSGNAFLLFSLLKEMSFVNGNPIGASYKIA